MPLPLLERMVPPGLLLVDLPGRPNAVASTGADGPSWSRADRPPRLIKILPAVLDLWPAPSASTWSYQSCADEEESEICSKALPLFLHVGILIFLLFIMKLEDSRRRRMKEEWIMERVCVSAAGLGIRSFQKNVPFFSFFSVLFKRTFRSFRSL